MASEIEAAGGAAVASYDSVTTPTVEALADHIDEITDLSTPVFFETGDEEMRLIIRGLG